MKYRVLLPLSLVVCLASGISPSQTDSDRVQDQLHRGLEAFKQYQYESAAEHFRLAHKLDPQSRQATLYLAGTLAQLYIPGVDTPDNLQVANDAIETYKQLLALDDKNITAFKSIASIEFNLRKFEDARSYYLQASHADSNDPEVPYAIGVIDWVQAYKERVEERGKKKLSMDGPSSIMQAFCPKLKANNLPLVEDGIQMMKKAIELRPDYDDAMAYLNLLYRERAEIQCHDRAARANDLQQANQWVNKAMETKKKNAEATRDAEPPWTPESLLSAPPPAPPPPPPPPKR